jgi:hypothetical protein
MGGFMGILLLIAQLVAIAAAPPPSSPTPVSVKRGDVFELPMSSWSPHCLGFGSQWRYCDGTALRAGAQR